MIGITRYKIIRIKKRFLTAKPFEYSFELSSACIQNNKKKQENVASKSICLLSTVKQQIGVHKIEPQTMPAFVRVKLRIYAAREQCVI